jgi:hypothetical protein
MDNIFHYINYSDHLFYSQQLYASYSAQLFGKVNSVELYSPADLDEDFIKIHHKILCEKRGGGYWLWKPYVILKKLKQIDRGDFLVYSDSGAVVLKPLSLIVSELINLNQDVASFELPLIERQWTKKYLFDSMGCLAENFADTNQRLSSFHVIKKTEFSLGFYEKFLKYSSSYENISDFNCNIGQDDGFLEHRHDQSIFSLLSKKAGLKAMKDPSQLGEHPTGYAGVEIPNFQYGQRYILKNGRVFCANRFSQSYEKIFFHSRLRNPIYSYARYNIARGLKAINLYKGIVR